MMTKLVRIMPFVQGQAAKKWQHWASNQACLAPNAVFFPPQLNITNLEKQLASVKFHKRSLRQMNYNYYSQDYTILHI